MDLDAVTHCEDYRIRTAASLVTDITFAPSCSQYGKGRKTDFGDPWAFARKTHSQLGLAHAPADDRQLRYAPPDSASISIRVRMQPGNSSWQAGESSKPTQFATAEAAVLPPLESLIPVNWPMVLSEICMVTPWMEYSVPAKNMVPAICAVST